jgi:hypothetical protein
MSKKAIRVFSREFKLTAVRRMLAGENVTALARGVRLIGFTPLGQWETITFVAALRHNKMTAPMVLEGAMTGEMFRAYVEQCLAPTLKRNDIVVVDNFDRPQGRGRQGSDREGGSDTAVPAEILTRSQSHRAALRRRDAAS